MLFLFAGGGTFFAGESRHPVFAARAGAEYHRAQTQFQLHPNDPAAAWQFARACFEFNDFVTNNAGRAELAGQGIAACRQSLARESNSAPGHYYLAIELGLLADTKRNLAAYKMVREMEREFKTAGNLDEHFDYAGPARCLGLLHRDAPGWPMSIGSRHKAREWLEQAVKLAPDYPENRLNLVESYWQWKDHEAARAELKTLDALWPSGPNEFHRRSVGAKLGRLVNPARCRARKTQRNSCAGETAEKFPELKMKLKFTVGTAWVNYSIA